MKKALVLLVGLTTMMISQPTAAANSSSWNPSRPDRTTPIPVEPYQFESRQFNQTFPAQSAPYSIPTPAQVTEVPPGNVNSVDRRINLPPSATQAPQLQPSANESFIPVAPAVPQTTPLQQATPIPYVQDAAQNSADLGVQFDLYTQPQPPRTYSPPQPTVPYQSASAIASDIKPPASESKVPHFTLKDLFSGDTNSLVAVAVGNAEGTRTPEGKNSAGYYGHSDPGNGVWNLGTFSYQHGANSPEEADKKQLNRLKKQAQVMQEQATAKGLKLTLEETLNGIDLANQAPKAVLDTQGYIDWLAKAHEMGMDKSEVILWARVQSFIDPKTQQWNAPGLGNNATQITRDQRRRVEAIANALQAQDYQISADARLRPQPIGFFFPKALGLLLQVAHKTADLFI